MADTSARPMTPTATERPPEVLYGEPSRWSGWIMFASVMMMLSGGLQATYGLIAALNDEWVVWGNRANLYLDLTTWGWLHMIVGTIVVLSGVGLLTGNILARIVGVLVAVGSLVANFLYVPAYPVWALTIIVIDVLVIWAITVHGGELKDG